TLQAVLNNAAQASFDVGQDGNVRFIRPRNGLTRASAAPMPTWLVLVHFDMKSGDLRTEVSLPNGIERSKVCSWSERILIPDPQWTTTNRDEADGADAEDSAIDVPITKL